ncbi:MAG: 3-phosphoshikimate 1-carboxyvinyltransferase [Clostridia bacterium]|nr:3-phosphoshikimate 1-carboxyvinyltransferase [Clostridia bacterium]
MDLRITRTSGLVGTIEVPGDKSISHRAVMLGALANGRTRVTNFLRSADCLATAGCFRQLGVAVEDRGSEVIIEGKGLHGLNESLNILDAGNSGTTMRLMAGILAGQDFFSCLTGDASLRSRPMSRVTLPLTRMGATILGRAEGSLAPLAIRGGRLKSIEYRLPVASAQVKSAVLLAGLFADGPSKVWEPKPSRDHTERMLSYFGAGISRQDNQITVHPEPNLTARDVYVPGDISSAAFFIVGALITPESDLTIRNVGVNPTRTGILDVLTAMGACIEVSNAGTLNGEPTADLRVRSSRLDGTEIGGSVIPRLIDEVPVLAVAAAFAGGRTVIRDAAELKVKESDRLSTTAGELRRFGAAVTETPDGLIIEGGAALKGASCSSHGDHRIAMALAIVGLASPGETVIRDAGAVSVSFPEFADVLNSVRLQY